MSVFLIAAGLTLLVLCLIFMALGNVKPDWKTLTVSSAVGAIAYGVSLLL